MKSKPRMPSHVAWWWVLLLAAMVSLAWPTRGTSAPRLARRHYTNGSSVLSAFEEAVSSPRRSTVRILANGRDAALGAVVDSEGWVLTKASQLAEPLHCRFVDGRELSARLVGVHQDFDLALLKVDADNLSPVQWSDAADPAVGAWLVTPGLDRLPVAVGVVSVARRRIGRDRGELGISIAEEISGPRITKVYPGSGADRAGLKVDDVISHVSGVPVRRLADISQQLNRLRPGDSVTIRVIRGNEQIDLRATLGHPSENFLDRRVLQNRIGGELSNRRAGFPVALQHDTVLRPQDCGGPLVDLDGRCVGLNIARAGRVETYAIPADQITPLLDELKSGKYAQPPLERKPLRPSPPQLPEDIVD